MHQPAAKTPKRPNPPKRPNDPAKFRRAEDRPKGKGKGRGRGKQGSPNIPKAILDLKGHSHTPDSEICYSHNLGKCQVRDCKRAHGCARCFAKDHVIQACKA